MYRQDETLEENMTLKEFVNQPYVIPLYAKYSLTLANIIRENPFIKIGKHLYGEQVILYVDSRRIGDLAPIFGTGRLEIIPPVMGLLGKASLEASTITQVQQQPYLNLNGRGTLIGIIDTGIDYTKRAFQYEDGTSKIKYIWDQTIEGNSPNGFLFGSEYTNEQINQALQTDTPYDIVPTVDTVRTWYISSITGCQQARR